MVEGPVIVPIDGSRSAENAFPLARELARLFQSPIRIVRVADSDETSRLKDLTEADRDFAEYALERAKEFGLDPESTTAHLLSGPPAPTILAEAKKENASIIVLASHGRSGFRAAVLGSVADKIVRGSHIPVLVVPGVGHPAPGITRILVPLDGSEESERALSLAREIAAGTRAHVTLLQAYSIVPSTATGFEYYVPEAIDATGENAKEYVSSLAKEGERSLVIQGDAARGIVDAANSIDADLVVMASSGKGLAGRLVMGSTTDRVLHSLQRPLLVVHRHHED